MKPIDRARAYVAKMPAAVSGQGGHDRTYRVACVLTDGFALQWGDAWTVLIEYNKRCLPPWSLHELRHKLEDAFRAAGSVPSARLLHAPRVPYACGVIRLPSRAIQTSRKVMPLDHVLGIPERGISTPGTAGTAVPDSYRFKKKTMHLHARGFKSAVPAVPSTPGSPSIEVDPETGYPIIDGCICPF